MKTEWISVKDTPPKLGIKVLVGNKRTVDIAKRVKGKQWQMEKNRFIEIHASYHVYPFWIPLPEPPTE